MAVLYLTEIDVQFNWSNKECIFLLCSVSFTRVAIF